MFRLTWIITDRLVHLPAGVNEMVCQKTFQQTQQVERLDINTWHQAECFDTKFVPLCHVKICNKQQPVKIICA